MPLVIQAPHGHSQAVSRPFLVGLLLLLLFLSTQTDWSPAARQHRMNVRHGLAGSSAQRQETIRDKLIYDLSMQNEKLEKENMRLRQRVMVQNRAVRACQRANSSVIPAKYDTFLDSELLAVPKEVTNDQRINSPPMGSPLDVSNTLADEHKALGAEPSLPDNQASIQNGEEKQQQQQHWQGARKGAGNNFRMRQGHLFGTGSRQ